MSHSPFLLGTPGLLAAHAAGANPGGAGPSEGCSGLGQPLSSFHARVPGWGGHGESSSHRAMGSFTAPWGFFSEAVLLTPEVLQVRAGPLPLSVAQG